MAMLVYYVVVYGGMAAGGCMTWLWAFKVSLAWAVLPGLVVGLPVALAQHSWVWYMSNRSDDAAATMWADSRRVLITNLVLGASMLAAASGGVVGALLRVF